MFSEIEDMILQVGETNPVTATLHENAVDLFLTALRAWGTSSSLRDRMKLYQTTLYNSLRGSSGVNEQHRLYTEADSAISARMQQSSAGYLQYEGMIENDSRPEPSLSNSAVLPTGVTHDSLFAMKRVKSFFEGKAGEAGASTLGISTHHVKAAILEIRAELYFMEGDFFRTLGMYLKLGAHNSIEPLSIIEKTAPKSILKEGYQHVDGASQDRFKHVLTLIQANDLQRSLLDIDSFKGGGIPPLVAFICLVGLQDGGRFIIDHCVLPNSKAFSISHASAVSLPIDMVAEQFKANPKLLLWFLHTILCDKPEIYVKFPNTAVPPSAVTALHRIHFDLYIAFIDRMHRSEKKLSNIPSFEELSKESALLKFLKVRCVSRWFWL